MIIIYLFFELPFLVGAVEGDENGYDEEYPLESLELNTNDFMAKVSLGTLFFTHLFFIKISNILMCVY
jgi:hypothetical protein